MNYGKCENGKKEMVRLGSFRDKWDEVGIYEIENRVLYSKGENGVIKARTRIRIRM